MNKSKKRMLIFHSTIAPYRIDFFNDIFEKFNTKVVLDYENLKSQNFDYDKIKCQFKFSPIYLKKFLSLGERDFYKGYFKQIKEFKPDIILTSEYGLGMWCSIISRFFKKKKYKIITICDDSLKIAEECSGLRKISRDLALKFLDGIILCNPQAEEWYNKNCNVKTFCFPIIHKDETLEKEIRKSDYLVNETINNLNLIGKKVFVYIGRLAPEKNLEYLVNSFIKANDKYDNIELLLVGDDGDTDGTTRNNIEKIIAFFSS